MKVLATREISAPLLFKGKFTIVWRSENREYCQQDVELKHKHIVNFAMIVQLNQKEANQLGLVNALGIFEGEKLS